MTLRRLLLRAYPRSWRQQYGEELAAVLSQRLGLAGATVKALESALAGQLAVVALYLLAPPRAYASLVLGHSIYYWFAKTLAINLAASGVCGFTGLILGRSLRPEAR